MDEQTNTEPQKLDTQQFLGIRFSGKRFDNHCLPLDLVDDVKAYQKCLFALAKHLYQTETGKSRVPKNFTQNWQLEIGAVQEGSVVLSLFTAASLYSLALDGADYFSRARDLISSTIEACIKDEQTPEEFPNECFDFFGHGIGVHLRDDESMTFVHARTDKARLTPKVRRALVERKTQEVHATKEYEGFIAEADADRQCFRLRTAEGKSIRDIPFGSRLDQKHVHELWGSKLHGIHVNCDVVMDSAGRLKKVSEPSSYKVLKNFKVIADLKDVCTTPSGWLEDGEGPEYQLVNWEWLLQGMRQYFPEALLCPCVTPSARGTVLFEWNTQKKICSVEFFEASKSCELIVMDKADVSNPVIQEMNCSSPDEWTELFNFLNSAIANA